jgi:hypothetical protein
MRIDSQWPRALVALALVALFSNRARAESFERIRPDPGLLTTVVATAFDRSAAFRSIAERIERSDVIVHLTCGYFKSLTLAGRTLLVTAGPYVRYVRVQVLCQQPEQALTAIVAHELQHVAEIASAASVVDDKSFARLFATIGFSTCVSVGSEQFETEAAIATGERVRSELRHYSESSMQVSHHVAGPVDRRGAD